MQHQDFTVGWICALQTEYVAACELLDDEYPPLPTDPNDNNSYTLGRIGDHHIVLACLPKGIYGIASAASVGKDMLRSFKSIRIGLMVGIGGGAPSGKHDIRLGDVVVACPVGSRGGVIPYNFGKAIQHKEFEMTGHLSSPPTVLLTAVNDLSAFHERKGNSIADSVQKMISKNPRLKRHYQCPSTEHDRLYESSYVHNDGDGGCEKLCSSAHPPEGSLLKREPRAEPDVHYGLIASADQLMMDAEARDELIKKHDILCFEMEAAGLMNDFPCVVIRGICDYSDSHKNYVWQGYAAATAASYAKGLLVKMPGQDLDRAQTATASMVKPLFSVPFERDINFIDRKDIFTQVERQLQIHRRASICGLGGVGKSQIAIEYAYRFQQSQPQSHVFWVYAATYGTFLQSCRDISRSLKLPACDEPKTDPCALVSKWLNEEDHSWLMILDNADNTELFFPSAESDPPPATVAQTQRPLTDYLPVILNSQKTLLVTTRNRIVGQDLAHGESCIEVPSLSDQEAKALLQSKLKGSASSSNVSDTERLLDVLGCIPLAITQAAAFVNRNRWTIQGYTAALENDRQNLTDHLSQELQDPRRPRGFPNSVFQTWKLSFDQILVQQPQTAKLLSLMAMLDPQRIPEKLLRRPAERDVDFRMAIGTLDGFALISQEIGGETYAIHPLVQASVHYWLEQRSEKADYAGQALQLLAEKFPNGEHENKETCESLLSHTQAVLCHTCISENDMEFRAVLLHNFGWFNWQQGRYVSAYEAALESYSIFQERAGDLAAITLNSLSLLALVLQNQGNYKAAEEMHRRALKGYEKVLGFAHPDTLISVGNIASVLREQGEYKAAEKMHRRALDGYERVLGVEHPYTLTNVNNLALVLQDQGEYKAAEKIYRRALEGKEKVLGVEHPETLITVSNLASLLRDQREYKAAEKMNRRALKGYEKVLGVEHPNTLLSVYHLAYLLQIQKRYHDASQLYHRASAGLTKTLGPDHPRTQACSNDYSSMIDEMQGQDQNV